MDKWIYGYMDTSGYLVFIKQHLHMIEDLKNIH